MNILKNMKQPTKLSRNAACSRRSISTFSKEVVVVGMARTPIGRFMGALSDYSAPQLGGLAIKEVLLKSGVEAAMVEEVFMGNVVSAGIGQAPARQAALFAGLPVSVPCTTINKVCASGMKAIMMGVQAIQSGHRGLIVAGGFESMSNIPHYVPALRKGQKLGTTTMIDGLIHDGLWDVYNNQHMGMCGEACAEKFGFSREQQDEYALESYSRAKAAWKQEFFKEEVFSIEIPVKKGGFKVFNQDEAIDDTGLNTEKIKSLKPAFKQGGTITAANASTINDGACALILASGERAKSLGLKPLAQILGFADAARDPVEFTIAPTDATLLAIKNAGLTLNDVQCHEINEAFCVVALANAQLMGLDLSKVNCFGGAVALGHPLGMSGARIVSTLYNVLNKKGFQIGCASICNGGGGASAIVIRKM